MKWSYKTVHFELKKEGILGSGFLDESEIEQELNEYGLAGWDLVSVLEVHDGMIAFFKQPFGSGLSTKVIDTEDSDQESENSQQQTASVQGAEPVLDESEAENRENRDEHDNGIGAIRIE
jgi:hypothetical protein